MMLNVISEIDKYLKRLFPICRSITGEGNRETLRILQEIVPLTIKEYPSGQQVYDWVIPKEWNIKDAWIKNSAGEKIIHFQKSNLHVVNCSVPVHKQLILPELKSHLHFREDLPEAIPYRTSYYKEDWGFCLSYKDYKKYFNDQESYGVFIDSELKDGSLTIGELLIKGKSDKEYLISTYLCHPSLANDNLSGVVLTAFLALELSRKELNYSFRIIWVPETIGAISYCANNESVMKKINAGFVITTVGGPGKIGYKQSWQCQHPINRIIEQTLGQYASDYNVFPFKLGSDERQYSSPGFRMNIASITKDKYYEYKYYHTSLDNLDFVKAEYINESLNLYMHAIEKLDKNITYTNLYPNCEVMLGKHNIYPHTGGGQVPTVQNVNEIDMMLALLFYCDGTRSLLEIADKLDIDIAILYQVAKQLEERHILTGEYA